VRRRRRRRRRRREGEAEFEREVEREVGREVERGRVKNGAAFAKTDSCLSSWNEGWSLEEVARCGTTDV